MTDGAASGGNRTAWLIFGASAIAVLMPLGALLYGSLRSGSPGQPGAVFTAHNLQNVFVGLLAGGWTQRPTVNSLLIAVPVTLLSCGLGVILAWAVARTDMWARKVFSVALLLPMFFSPLIGIIGWSVLAEPNSGFINQLWQSVHHSGHALVNVYSYAGIIWVMVFFFAPYAFILNIGTFSAMDPALEEAASMAGANLWHRLVSITLPILVTSIAAAALFIFTLSLEQFAIPGFLGSFSHISTLAYSIYLRTNAYPTDLPGAASAGILLLLITSASLFAYRRFTARSEKFVTVTGRGYKPSTIELKRAKPFVFAFCAAVLLIGAVLPLAAVVLRSLMTSRTSGLDVSALGGSNFVQLLRTPTFWTAMQNSLLLAAGCATICALIGFIVGILVVRRKSRPIAMADYLLAMPFGVPGTVFGVGMLWAYVRTPLYLTMWILLLAFVLRYAAYAVRALSAGMMQLDRSLEEAAMTSGASSLKTFEFVNLPLLRPVFVSVWLLVFLISMQELSTSIILYSPKSITLSILTWSYLNDGYYGVASAVAVVQVVLVAAVAVLFRVLFGVGVRMRGNTIAGGA